MDTDSPTIYLRYNNEYLAPGTGTVTPLTMSEERGWVRKVFTAEHPDFTYSFYPKIMQLVDNAGVFSTESRVSKSMPWTNINTPVELYGMKVYTYWAGNPNNTYYMNCDVLYHLEFKEQQ